jgi:hypothetical protein
VNFDERSQGIAVSGQPGYWMHETSGVLAPVVMRYLEGADLADDEIATMRAYLRQWLASPFWTGPDIYTLRTTIDAIYTTAQLRLWLERALDAGIDPL